jgi:hypothetical protein
VFYFLTKLALANMDFNDPVLETITFDDGDPLEGSSSTIENADLGLHIEGEGEERVVAMVVILMIQHGGGLLIVTSYEIL